MYFKRDYFFYINYLFSAIAALTAALAVENVLAVSEISNLSLADVIFEVLFTFDVALA